MRCEWPALTKCCFCMPLRKGLLVWGYLKLVFTLIVISSVGYNLVYILSNDVPVIPLAYVVIGGFLLINFIDAAFQVIFIISAHNKNHRYMRWYCRYTLTLVCIVSVTSFSYLCFLIAEMQEYIFFIFFIPWVAPTVLMLIIYICLHTYFLILAKSEVTKLKSNAQFEFVNRAEEEKCHAVNVEIVA